MSGSPCQLATLRFAFLGGRSIAYAIITGLIASGVSASQIRVVAPSSLTRQRLRETFAVSAQRVPCTDFGRSDVLVLAVKPQQLQAAVRDLLPHMQGG